MLYCVSNLESIERILERRFRRTDCIQNAEIAKYENGVFTYLGSTYQVYAGNECYEMDQMAVEPDGLLRTFRIKYAGHATPSPYCDAVAKLSTPALAVYQQGPGAVHFTSAVALAADKKLGIFFFCSDFVSELAVRLVLSKHDLREIKDEPNIAQTWVSVLKVLGRF